MANSKALIERSFANGLAISEAAFDQPTFRLRTPVWDQVFGFAGFWLDAMNWRAQLLWWLLKIAAIIPGAGFGKVAIKRCV